MAARRFKALQLEVPPEECKSWEVDKDGNFEFTKVNKVGIGSECGYLGRLWTTCLCHCLDIA